MANILLIVQAFLTNSFSVSSRFMTTDIAPIMLARAIAISGGGKRLATQEAERGGVRRGVDLPAAFPVTTEYITRSGQVS